MLGFQQDSGRQGPRLHPGNHRTGIWDRDDACTLSRKLQSVFSFTLFLFVIGFCYFDFEKSIKEEESCLNTAF
jgi:hypothetical protein